MRFSHSSPTATRYGDATRRRFDFGSRSTEHPDTREEFREFAAASQGHLRRSAYLLCGDWHFAEDIVQNAFDRIYRHWNRVRAADNPSAYARQVVYRCFLDSRKKHLDTVPLEHLPEKASQLEPPEPTETRLAVMEALKQLPARTRAVVVLRYWEDMSVEQTAAILDISQGTVKSLARKLDGGTVYVYEQASAAEDQAIPSSPLHDVLKPGTEKDIVSRTLAMTFVPDDRSKYVFHFVVQAATAPMQFVDHAPADIERGIPWPPASLVMPELDPSGPLVSGDDLVAMLAKPGLDRLEYLLDSRTPVSKDAAAEAAAAEGRLAAAAEAALPAGLTVGVDDSMTEPQLMVTGTKGKNQLYWTAFVLNAQERQQSYGNCLAGDGCTRRTVPGGALEVMAQYPNGESTTPSDNPAMDHYVFLPDDLSKPVLDMVLNALPLTPQNSSLDPTASPGQIPKIHGPYAPLLVTPDQFVAAAEDGRLATAIATTKSLIAALE